MNNPEMISAIRDWQPKPTIKVTIPADASNVVGSTPHAANVNNNTQIKLAYLIMNYYIH